jgi:DNA-binding PadR family transcriptional regulator
MQDAVLGLLAKEPSYGYELRGRIQAALGPFGEAMNAGQIYVTLGRLEKGDFVQSVAGEKERSDRKVYALTSKGHERVHAWLADTDWPHLVPIDFHLKLVTVAAAKLHDPIAIIDAQRRELLRQLSQVQQATLSEPDEWGSVLLQGAVLRLQADLKWLETCEQVWMKREDHS